LRLAKDKPSLVEWYNALSNSYDELYLEEQSRKQKLVLELLPDKKFGLMLDVGCGTGNLLGAVQATADHIVGIDLSEGMLRKAKSLRSKKIDLLRADCSWLPLRNGLAQCVVAISVIESGDNGRQQFVELERVCRSDGSLVFTMFHDEQGTIDGDMFGQLQVEQQSDISARERLFLARRPPEN
jgi:ubiquinone/menaquinone biosynthesis C-methylase UbiE